MQDEDRLRDRVELALDNRQIFLLFSASAVVLSLVFALGVVVGKRLSPLVAAQPKSDPLSMLDRAGAKADDHLTFPQELAGNGSAVGKANPQADDKTEPSNTAAAAASGKTKASAKSATARRHDKKAKTGPAKTAPAKARDKLVPPPLPEPPVDMHSKRPAQRLADASKTSKTDRTKKKTAKAKKKAEQKTKTLVSSGSGMRYTLQLSSFQDRHEAELFMAKLRTKGHDPHMVPTRIPGRGLWYRVRLGDYGNWKQALTAKQTFERETKSIAYVARR